ncbi:hypothetical protein [Actinoplanes regularis]|uniref:hypothetical protein n=1 Tax=Actinoplanes regularis TaxID=52697 RepID=UPI0024A55644|nr:hypothetical protein [Actinoplanes regularis]GLW31076.1 hypothetical protein Areg01_40160 [Actinoplanes regularis]
MSDSQWKLELLARSIQEDLATAGLELIPNSLSALTGAGVSVWVDAGNTGVNVQWNTHHALNLVVREELARLQRDGPALRYSAAVSEAMREAIATILVAGGYLFDKDSGSAYEDFRLLVTGRQEGPSWRDWHEAQRGRRGRVQGRLLSAHSTRGRVTDVAGTGAAR